MAQSWFAAYWQIMFQDLFPQIIFPLVRVHTKRSIPYGIGEAIHL
ncbi:hypothetical protein Dfer_1831 [Dyadobacter fermentans DSM 18053]|uniref:Uncharacterized protein n=1 Tax=Dyadobacter fermentans (strain ATCC 700827 / DSM 18053 / CIP 107007 / KCTC 52180 / NS114) TaxID=471854 RepID=C6VUT1_DYAFD|nr:hypothetical protein Dfer_1831 [Dyadobacter fermentans DSM 18053]